MLRLYQNEILAAIYAKAQDAVFADKLAIQEVGGKGISYRDFVQAIEATALNLVQHGFQCGERVLILLRPKIDLLIVVLAVVRAGGVLVIADPAMGQAVFEERIRLAAPQWVFAESLFLLLQKSAWLRRLLKRRGIEIPEMARMNIPNQVNVGKIPFLAQYSFDAMRKTAINKDFSFAREGLRPSSTNIQSGAANIRDNVQNAERANDEDITIVFTSGTTGQPKGVVHTIGSMLANIGRVRAYAQLNEQDVIYDTGVLFILPALMVGAAVVFCTGKFDAEATLQAYRDYGVTKTLEIPANMQAMLKVLQQRGEKLPDTLQDLMLGAAPVYADFLENLQGYSAPNTRIWSIYGMTELLPTALVSLQEKLAFERGAGDLVGKPMDGICAEIAADGELLLSGAGLFHRYLGQAPLVQHPTGDMARLDEQGRIVLLGRKKDMIIKGHYNIYPPLFEPIIRQIEGVADAAMVGVYHPQKADEEIVLFVQAEAGQDLEILRKRLERELLSGVHSIDVYAQADHIFFAEIPYNGRSRKLDKKALRLLACERLDLAEESSS